MLRGKTWFRCSCCRHVFKSWDIEDNATVKSMPMPCPKCGGKGFAIYRYGPLDRIEDYILGKLFKKKEQL